MSAQPQLSLCIPDCSEVTLLQEFQDNVNQFFSKFPIQYEVLLAVRANQDESRAAVTKLTENPRYRILDVPSSLSRAQTLEALFSESQGDILVSSSLDLATPLGEIFRLMQEMYSDKDVQVVFGNRFDKKKRAQSESATPVSSLERFFQGVILEKTQWPFEDVFCPVFAIRKTAFAAIKLQLKSSGWHWTQEIQRSAVKAGLKVVSLPIYEGSRKKKSFGWREPFQLLSFVIFRV